MTTLTGRVARSSLAPQARITAGPITRRRVMMAGAALGALLSPPTSLSRVSAQADPSGTIASTTDRLPARRRPRT